MNVQPEPTRVGSFLMKSTRAFNQSGEALQSRFQQLLRSEPIAQKVESLFSFADLAFVRMDGDLQDVENGVRELDCRALSL